MQIHGPMPTEGDRLFTRLLMGLEAETQLTSLSKEGITNLFASIDDEAVAERFAIPSSEDEVKESLYRLESAGYISVDESNPHVQVALTGFLDCGILDIPSELRGEVIEHMDRNHLT